ncbi:MAG TPA: type II toxin-antitoxin system RelE/ParE family toxin [bacterium]
MYFNVLYHPNVKKDLAKINSKVGTQIKRAVENRLRKSPEQYGEPLRKTLKGYWKLRVGNYRIVFKINGNEIWILGIMHRKNVYKEVNRRKNY